MKEFLGFIKSTIFIISICIASWLGYCLGYEDAEMGKPNLTKYYDYEKGD